MNVNDSGANLLFASALMKQNALSINDAGLRLENTQYVQLSIGGVFMFAPLAVFDEKQAALEKAQGHYFK